MGANGSEGLEGSRLEHFQLNPDRVSRGEAAGAPVGCDGCSPGYNLKADPDFAENALAAIRRRALCSLRLAYRAIWLSAPLALLDQRQNSGNHVLQVRDFADGGG
jgi:hypothetical protein